MTSSSVTRQCGPARSAISANGALARGVSFATIQASDISDAASPAARSDQVPSAGWPSSANSGGSGSADPSSPTISSGASNGGPPGLGRKGPHHRAPRSLVLRARLWLAW